MKVLRSSCLDPRCTAGVWCRGGHVQCRAAKIDAPWTVLFDLRERETEWTLDNKARLVKIVAKKELGIPLEQLQRRLDTLLTLLPDLEERVESMHPNELVSLLQDPPAVGRALIELRALLPLCDVGRVATRAPHLLRPDALKRLAQELEQVCELLGVESMLEDKSVAVESPTSALRCAKAIEEQPLLLDSECVKEALEELRRLMPKGTNVQHMLLRDPAFMLRVQRGQKHLGENPDSFPDASYIEVKVPKHDKDKLKKHIR